MKYTMCVAPIKQNSVLCNNFSYISGQSCYSCRAFFRRTSVKNPSKFRCRTGKHDCKISNGVKTCISCRLDKCLKVSLLKISLSVIHRTCCTSRTVYRTPYFSECWDHLIKCLFLYEHPKNLSETQNHNGS